jgi:glucosyl-3-phosphoglycerate synthase
VNLDAWAASRTYVGADFEADALIDAKQHSGARVSVCLPALNVARTIAPIIEAVRDVWLATGLVDEILVVNGSSTDATADVARRAGARVVDQDAILPEAGPGTGKGEALWKSLAEATGDLVVWLDSDVHNFDPMFVPGLLGPLLTDPDVGYVKALYQRPLGDGAQGGGRVTEICARPLINLFYPQLAGFSQPLSGEAAGRRSLLEAVPFFSGYAVEVGLLIDLLDHAGLGAMAQVDLGLRRHDHQTTANLGRMGFTITQAVLRRLAQAGRLPAELVAMDPEYVSPAAELGQLESWQAGLAERPPMRQLLVPAQL